VQLAMTTPGKAVGNSPWKRAKVKRSTSVPTHSETVPGMQVVVLCARSLGGSNPNERDNPEVRDNAVCIWGK